MKKTVIGHKDCPTCGHSDAEIKEDKNGKAFLFCPDCATQVFTRNAHRDQHMRKNMRAVTVTVTVTEPAAPIPTAPPEPAIAAAPQPAPAVTPEPPPKTPPAPVKKAGWFQPLIGSQP